MAYQLSNDDLRPTSQSERTWNKWDVAALWVGMSICIPTYTIASSFVADGHPLMLSVLAIAMGNIIVLLPMLVNAHAGTRYGVPFPVLLRSSFGVIGCNIPAVLRAMVACGWFGIQSWIGGKAIHIMFVALFPSGWELPVLFPKWFGISLAEFLCFVGFWAINVAIIARGIETLRVVEKLAAPILLAMGVGLFLWALLKVGWSDMTRSDVLQKKGAGAKSTWDTIAAGLTIGVAYWGTLALNIPDFSRFARSQRDQVIGQTIGLPPTMTAFVFIGATVTTASFFVFGAPISDPTTLIAKLGGPALLIVAMFALAIATLSTNLAANIVGPANDISNLAPDKISFKKGAFIAATIGLVIMPWKLYQDPKGYIYAWLGGYGVLLGAVGGIMIFDYVFVRRGKLNTEDLYRRGGEYEYSGGFNWVALVAFAVGVLPNLLGFLHTLNIAKLAADSPFLKIYQWGWFVAFGLAGVTYLLGMRLFPQRKTNP